MAENTLIELGLGLILDSYQIYNLKVLGAFDLMDGYGKSVRPSGRKECAILAMLALTANHRQTRAWLQDKLWGDRGPAQGSASLRHALSKIRGILNTQGDVIRADRTWVWLEPSRIQFDHLKDDAAGEVLRGFDLREEGFNEWLREVRVQHDNRLTLTAIADLPRPHTDAERYLNRLRTSNGVGDDAFKDQLLEQRQASEAILLARPPAITPIEQGAGAFQNLRPLVTLLRGSGLTNSDREVWRLAAAIRSRLVCLEVFDIREGFEPMRDGFGFVLSIERVPPNHSVATLMQAADGRVLASIRQEATDEDEDASGALIERTVESLLTVTDLLGNDESRHFAALTDLSVVFDGLFVPGSQGLPEISKRIDEAIELRTSGVQYALRSSLLMLRFGERLDGAFDVTREMVKSDLRASLLASPDNGLVHALAAHAQSLFLSDHRAAIEHGRLAVEAAPESAISWAMLALAQLRASDVSRARNPAARALALGRMSRYRAFFEGVCAAVDAAAHDYVSSRWHCERCLLLAPDFQAVRWIEFLACERTGAVSSAEEIGRALSKDGAPFGRASIEAGAVPINIETLRKPLAESTARLGFH